MHCIKLLFCVPLEVTAALLSLLEFESYMSTRSHTRVFTALLVWEYVVLLVGTFCPAGSKTVCIFLSVHESISVWCVQLSVSAGYMRLHSQHNRGKRFWPSNFCSSTLLRSPAPCYTRYLIAPASFPGPGYWCIK